jgi:hypothetical protein
MQNPIARNIKNSCSLTGRFKWIDILEQFPTHATLINKMIKLDLGDTITETIGRFADTPNVWDAISDQHNIEPLTDEQFELLSNHDVLTLLDDLHYCMYVKVEDNWIYGTA